MEALTAGATVDRYRLVAQLGEGGQGSVWRAEDPLHHNAPVALKLISLLVVPGAAIDRLRREARALARLSHPSLPRCHAFFEDLHKDVLGFALDLVVGSPLSELIDSKDLTLDHRRWILLHLADALRYIHEAGLVHRDLKPQNVMIARAFFARPDDPAGVKLVDFGIAAAANNPSPLTQAGGVIGTIEYLAPELLDPGHWKEAGAGPERDVYAFGVLAFQLLEGRHPLGLTSSAGLGDFLVAYREKTDSGAWPPKASEAALDPVYARCLALRATRRAENGARLLELMNQALPSPAVPPPRAPATSGSTTLESARDEVIAHVRAAEAQVKVRPAPSPGWLYPVIGFVAAAGFSAAFWVNYHRGEAPLHVALPALSAPMPSAPLEEPPFDGRPAPPSHRPTPAHTPLFTRAAAASASAPASAPAAASASAATSASAAASASAGVIAVPSCPPEMAPVAGAPGFCIDRSEVTVHDYCNGGPCEPAKHAAWLGARPAELTAASANCTAARPDMADKPITCVSYTEAKTYCTSKGKRLPTMGEWGLGATAISLCQVGDRVCPLFEWSDDEAKQRGYRHTRGPSWHLPTVTSGSNDEGAKNDDLGFRCAKTP